MQALILNKQGVYVPGEWLYSVGASTEQEGAVDEELLEPGWTSSFSVRSQHLLPH